MHRTRLLLVAAASSSIVLLGAFVTQLTQWWAIVLAASVILLLSIGIVFEEAQRSSAGSNPTSTLQPGQSSSRALGYILSAMRTVASIILLVGATALFAAVAWRSVGWVASISLPGLPGLPGFGDDHLDPDIEIRHGWEVEWRCCPVAALDDASFAVNHDDRLSLFRPKEGEYERVEFNGSAESATVMAPLAGNRIATGSSRGNVRVWNISSPSDDPIGSTGHQGAVTSIVETDGSTFVTSGRDGRIIEWTIADQGLESREVASFGDEIEALAARNSTSVIVAFEPGDVIVLELDGRGYQDVVRCDDEDRLYSFLESRQDGVVLWACDTEVLVGDIGNTFDDVRSLPRGDTVHSLELVGDSIVAIGGFDNLVRLYNLDRLFDPAVDLVGQSGNVEQLVDLNGNLLSVSRDEGLIWDVGDWGRSEPSLIHQLTLGRSTPVLLSDGSLVAVTEDRVLIWRPETLDRP